MPKSLKSFKYKRNSKKNKRIKRKKYSSKKMRGGIILTGKHGNINRTPRGIMSGTMRSLDSLSNRGSTAYNLSNGIQTYKIKKIKDCLSNADYTYNHHSEE